MIDAAQLAAERTEWVPVAVPEIPFDPGRPWADEEPAVQEPDEQIEHAEMPRPRPWRPLDLTAVLAGQYRPPEPSVGARNDKVGFFYPGRVHSVASEAEAGKTWLCLVNAAFELGAGRAVLYLDFEDDEGGIVGRLLALGVPRDTIRDRFAYLRPDQAIGVGTNSTDLAEVLADLKPTLAVLDGVTEAMALHHLELKDDSDVARFGALLPRRIAARGPAVVLLDHVPKSTDNRGRFAIGGQHKLAGLNGAAYVLDSRQPFGIGVTGRSSVKLAKDRPGQLRRHALPAGDGLHWFADLTVRSEVDGSVFAELWPPREQLEDGGFRPTGFMAKVCRVLAEAPGGLSRNAIVSAARGRKETVLHALELLVSEGYVAVEKREPQPPHPRAALRGGPRMNENGSGSNRVQDGSGTRSEKRVPSPSPPTGRGPVRNPVRTHNTTKITDPFRQPTKDPMARQQPTIGAGIPTAAATPWLALRAGLATTATPCQGPDRAAWFANDATTRAAAAEACGHCRLRGPCHDYATAAAEPGGVWGGQDRQPRAPARRPHPTPPADTEDVERLVADCTRIHGINPDPTDRTNP